MERSPFEGKSFSTPEEELAYLREELRKRESALENLTPKSHEQVGVKEPDHAREVVTEYAQTSINPEDSPNSPARIFERATLGLAPEVHDTKVDELLELAQEKGIQYALRTVRNLNDPHLEDDFHRLLAEYIKTDHSITGVEKNKGLFRALNLSLFEVTVSKTDLEDETEDSFKSTHARMQELLSGLRSIARGDSRGGKQGFYFSVEIALEHVGSNVRFFVAVPKEKEELFEKQFSALFPTARLAYAKDDYNIFSDSGASSVSRAKLKEPEVLPLRTFDSFDSDPLNTVLSTLTQLEHEGEGAALQFLFSPQEEKVSKRFRTIQEKVRGGAKLKEAIADGTFTGEFKKILFPQKPSTAEQGEKTVDEDVVERIGEKVAAPLYGANIRVVASARDAARARAIRETIESAFNQFGLEGSNSLAFQEMRSFAAQKLLRKYAFRLFDSKNAFTLNSREASTLVHIPGRGTHVLKSAGLSGRESGAPPSDLPESGLLLGTNTYRGRERKVFLSPDDRLRHLYVIGQTGTGKSTMLKNMITQDILNGEGVCMIDPHGSDIEDILAVVPPERHDDVIYFDPSDQTRPMGLNMLEFDRTRPEQKTFVVNEMLSIFNKLFDMKTAGGPMFEQYFRNAVLLALEGDEPATLLDVSRVLADANYRNKKISESYNPVVIQFWNEVANKAGGEAALQNIVPYITSKFDVFLSNDIMRPIIAQKHSAFNFREVMDGKKILLVNLSKGRLGDINSSLIGLIIVGKLLLAALSRVDSRGGDFPPFYLYLDEFQNITTDSIAVILSEARKYKLSLTVAHQFIAQLSDDIRDAVFGNVGSMASFRVGADDAEYLEKVFAPTFSSQDIMNTENRHALLRLLVHGTPRDPFSIATTPPLEGSEAQVESLKNLSRERFGRDRIEVERAIIEGYRKQ